MKVEIYPANQLGKEREQFEGVQQGTIEMCMIAEGPIAGPVRSRWLYPGFELRLFPDECKGYFLNLTSGAPSWFVSWREHPDDPTQVEVSAVSVSYVEADRRMAAEERVESVPLAPELCEWLQSYTNRHFRPEGARKQRAQSFLSPAQRQRLADEASSQSRVAGEPPKESR